MINIYESKHALEKTNLPKKVHVRKRWMKDGYHKRIQKKWLKRWGYVWKPCIFKTPQGLFVHPSLMREVTTLAQSSPH